VISASGNPDDQDENTLRTQVTTSGREPFPPMARGGTSEDSARREERKPRTLGQGRNTAWSVAVAGVYVYTISDGRVVAEPMVGGLPRSKLRCAAEKLCHAPPRGALLERTQLDREPGRPG